jgi:uncharacterized membrane protein YgaE (UPF0421/DUF939 family)
VLVLELLFAVIVALLFSFLLVALFGWQRPDRPGAGPAFIYLFMILLFAVWAGGAYMQPVGPMLWGVAWVSFIVIGLLISLVILALIPPKRPRTRRERAEAAQAEAEAQAGAESLASAFFWMLLVLLLLAVVFRHL